MKQILEMIESVDVNDTAKLDEIDARVWCWLYHPEIPWDKVRLSGRYNYCGSRDALKAIRPEGWIWDITAGHTTSMAAASKYGDDKAKTRAMHGTEELAELQVILMAIAHERGEDA